ncbi:hypothetical protein SEMRO_768_G199570.1 [Seminavis robusta]|uniref:Uncharacterized protein n=1 Tax=Seminavis robusta TaxID=568900 RepID=A0A9N8E997_9STRA|nr:hypothetical protein SEMRO_768_G199570.1 [Seminavis robusta]|eukprot:Sro768_g199570.1 n/a (129) ;mRNA; f:2183-2569
MVRCLCRLHNFCINERLEREQGGQPTISPVEESSKDVAERLAADDLNIVVEGGGVATGNVGDDYRPEILLHGGEHFDDVSYWTRTSRKSHGDILPREKMLSIVVENGLKRPTPRGWIGKTPAGSKYSS